VSRDGRPLPPAPGPLWDEPRPPVTEPREWVVAFTDVDGRSRLAHWLLSWFRPGFRHVHAFGEVEGGLLLVQLTTARLQVCYLPGETVASRMAYLEALGPVDFATMPAYPGQEAAWVPRGTNCVSTTRALAGKPPRVQTPFGLWRELSRRPRSQHGREQAEDSR